MKKLVMFGAATAALSLATLSTPAEAGSNIGVGFSINSGPAYYPAPVYVAPRPVYYAPAPVVYRPYPVYYGSYYGGRYGSGYWRPHGYERGYWGYRGHGRHGWH